MPTLRLTLVAEASQTKVTDFEREILAYEQVLRLDVPVDHVVCCEVVLREGLDLSTQAATLQRLGDHVRERSEAAASIVAWLRQAVAHCRMSGPVVVM